MKVVCDNIIFSLQKAGGISVVWYELLRRYLKDDDFELTFIENHNALQNIYRKNLQINEHDILFNNRKVFLDRYLSPPNIFSSKRFIFHSSYYRSSHQKNSVNITTVHDFTYLLHRSYFPRLINFTQIKNAVKQSKGIICISQNTKNDLLKFIPDSEHKEIVVIHNGVGESFYRLEERTNFDLNGIMKFESYQYAIYIGDRRARYKNFFQTVEACAKFDRFPLLMIGGGPLTSNETKILDKYLGKNRYVHVGIISSEILNILYNFAFCLVYPSSYEGFGIPIIEAQKAGCPVICQNVSSIPEIVGNSALLLNSPDPVEIVSKMELLKSNIKFRQEIITLGEKNALRFSWDLAFEETKSFYQRIYEKNY